MPRLVKGSEEAKAFMARVRSFSKGKSDAIKKEKMAIKEAKKQLAIVAKETKKQATIARKEAKKMATPAKKRGRPRKQMV